MRAIDFLAGKSFSVVSFVVVSTIAFMTTGCGSLPGPPPPAFSGNTNVTVLLSSTANDQLSEFGLTFNSLSLTNKAGKVFTLLASPQGTEFIHLNGATEPLLTVSIPEGVYTSATASIGYAYFTCVTLIPPTGTVPGGLLTAIYAYGSTPNSQVSLYLPSPITIRGGSMGVSVKMATSQSATLGSCYAPAGSPNPYSITPTFEITPVSFSGQGANSAETGLNGEISTVNAVTNSFSMTLADGQGLSAATGGNTVFQGLADLSALKVGMFVNIDAVIQPDGSQMATRIEAEDTDIINLSVSTGPLLQMSSGQPTLFAFGRQDQGFLRASGRAGEFMPYSFGGATFHISGRLTNLQNLPFSAVFDAAHMFAGQNVYVTSHAVTLSPAPTYFPATTITLIPQTINGTITGVSSDGGFTTYTVTLAAYDLIPNLAVQAGQTTVLIDPSSIVVYVDSNTQMLNTKPLAFGRVARFDGMIFDDSGIARMDCGQVFDGVAE
jgi:hypothetical protein